MPGDPAAAVSGFLIASHQGPNPARRQAPLQRCSGLLVPAEEWYRHREGLVWSGFFPAAEQLLMSTADHSVHFLCGL